MIIIFDLLLTLIKKIDYLMIKTILYYDFTLKNKMEQTNTLSSKNIFIPIQRHNCFKNANLKNIAHFQNGAINIDDYVGPTPLIRSDCSKNTSVQDEETINIARKQPKPIQRHNCFKK